ncbi:DUF6301 family protein [Nocardia sp. KC 131]|uniref:DUF6301 family protein n=1 Tax=Nocardia arseniciresistens TaxID=3392119 RepID=UPI00398F0214
MGAAIWVDRQGVSEMAKAAREFEEGWTRLGVEGLLAQVWPNARISGTDDRVDHIVIVVADARELDEGDCRPALAAALHEVSTELWRLWDEPSGVRVAAETGASWTFPKIVVGVTVGERSIDLWLINPAEQRRLADIEQRAVAEFITSKEWTTVVAAVAVLAQADPDTWSRTDMGRTFGVVGWTLEEDESGTVRANSGAASLGALRSSEFQRRYGYGEFQSMWLMARLPAQVLDLAYTAALAECVQILGTPSFVGGPNAFATWRRSATTLMLSRSARLGTGLLEMDLLPTEAKENADYSNAKWDEDWEPLECWRIRPDDTTSRADIDGMWLASDPKATDWTSFDRNVQRLFSSLATDLPVLHPYATAIVWVIVPADEQGFVAQGWFEATRSRVETKEGGETVFRDFPPGVAAAEEIIAITQAAVRVAAEAPDGLRYYAFATAKPQCLMDFRLGLADSVDR